MALPDIKPVDLQYLDQWLTNLVDTLNVNLQKIMDEVPTLDRELTTIDAVPIQYLRDSLDDLVNNMNEAFEVIDDRFRELESRLTALEK